MRRWRTLFKLSFVMLVIVVLVCKLRSFNVMADNTERLDVQVVNSNAWMEGDLCANHYDLIITNNGDRDVDGWEITIHIPGMKNAKISSEWNIKCTIVGDRIAVVPDSEFTKKISAGESLIDIGMIVFSDNEIIGKPVVNGPGIKPNGPVKPEGPTSSSKEDVIPPPTETQTEPITDVPTEGPTEPITEAPTEEQTEPTTEAPTEEQTEPTTESPTESEVESETDSKPEDAVEIEKDGNYYLYTGTTYYLAEGQWECSKGMNVCVVEGDNVFYVREDGTYTFLHITE